MPDPRESMRELQRMADRVCVLILSSDLPAIDIAIERNKVCERCLERMALSMSVTDCGIGGKSGQRLLVRSALVRSVESPRVTMPSVCR